MKLSEIAKKYYNDGRNCAEAILLASNERYGLGLCDEASKLIVGFGGGMGCGRVCGTLAGSIAVLGKLFSDRPDFRQMCAEFVKVFEDGLGCDSVDCKDLVKKYKNEETRCLGAVIKGAELLEQFIENKK